MMIIEIKGELRKLNLSKDDVLVITCDALLSANQIDNLNQYISRVIDNKFIILSNGVKLSAIIKSQLAEGK